MLQPNSTATGAAFRIWRAGFVAAALLLLLPATGWAQQPRQKITPASKANPRVYTFVEQMPELPGGGGMPAVAAYFMRHFHLTVLEARAATGGSVTVEFVVVATGRVIQAHIVRSGGASIDAAALRTIKSLPCFHPGHQGGIPVSVKLVLPVDCIKFQ